ncbi:hypothetical protein AWZ03_011204, partial [Drosophila navojoa]
RAQQAGDLHGDGETTQDDDANDGNDVSGCGSGNGGTSHPFPPHSAQMPPSAKRLHVITRCKIAFAYPNTNS